MMYDCPDNSHDEDDHKYCENNIMWIINVNKGGREAIRHGDRIALRTYSGSWFGCYNEPMGQYRKDQCYAHSMCPGNNWDKWSENTMKTCATEIMVVIAPARANKECSVEKAGKYNHDCVGDPIQKGDNVYFQLNSDRLFKVSGKNAGEYLKIKENKNNVDFSETTKPSESFYLWSVAPDPTTHLLPGFQSDNGNNYNKKCYEDCLARTHSSGMSCKIMPGDEVMFSNTEKSGSVVYWQCDADENKCVPNNCPGTVHNVEDHVKCAKNRFWIENLRHSKSPIRHGDYIGLRFMEPTQEPFIGCSTDSCYVNSTTCPKEYQISTGYEQLLQDIRKKCNELVMRVVAPARATEECTAKKASNGGYCQGDLIYAGDEILLQFTTGSNRWLSSNSEKKILKREGCPRLWHKDVMTNCRGEIFNIWSKANHLGIY